MSEGRTSWYSRDHAWHRRGLIKRLGREHGPAALAVLDVLCGWAQEQRSAGRVKGDYFAVGDEAFCDEATARAVMASAERLGVLDDLEDHEDGMRFVVRISGWGADQEHAKASNRQQRARDKASTTVTDRDESVTDRDDSSPTRPDQTRPTSSLRSDVARPTVNDDEWPADLPDSLHLAAEHVHKRLGELAEIKRTDQPSKRRVGMVLRDFPNHDHRTVVGDVVDYWGFGGGKKTAKKDLARVYRDRCSRVPEAREPQSGGRRNGGPVGNTASVMRFLGEAEARREDAA